MGVNISYMGTKRELIPYVSDVISKTTSDVMLDLFSGMCSVGEAIGEAKCIWSNDAQRFAYEVATALFCSQCEPMRPVEIANKLFGYFDRYQSNNYRNRARSIESEQISLESIELAEFFKLRKDLSAALHYDLLVPSPSEFNLFFSIYADTYIGVKQASDIDAISATIREARSRDIVSADQYRWLLISLGRAMLRISTSTGHFAQFTKPNSNNYKVFSRQRKRNVWREFLQASDELVSVGKSDWRQKNKSFNDNSLNLLPELAKRGEFPGLVYADPPYTDDQYSRYYHLFETLVLYDYPLVTGAGLYRPNRFRTPFSIKSHATSALEYLIHTTSSAGSDIILSYPTNGLVYEAGQDPYNLLRAYYQSVEKCYAIEHQHSTFGASKGAAKAPVIEQIFWGRL